MNLDAIFTYVVNNSVMITQWLVVCVFATSILYIGFRLFAKDKSESSDLHLHQGFEGQVKSAASLVSPLAPSVDEIMSQPGMGPRGLDVKTPTPQSASGGVGGGAVPPAEILMVTQELSKKENEIRQLREQIENAKSSSLDASSLKAKIEELQGKLAEYEILEDDIADLSKFKEENAKLKAELEALKNGTILDGDEEPTEDADDTAEGSMEEPDGGEEALAKAPVPDQDDDPISKDDLMAQFEATLEAETSGAAKREEQEVEEEEEAQDTEPVKAAGDDEADFVAEFEAAVQQQKVTGDEDEESESEASQMPTGDDILAEFAESLSTTSAAEDESGLNTDKMLAEMADLGESNDDGGDSALEEETDTEKMAREASRLLSGEE